MSEAILLLCLKIFLCRILDVSLGTIRMVVVVKGKSFLSAVIAVLEGLIWFLVVREALLFDAEESKFLIAIAYAGGFAVGSFVGGVISKSLIKTMVQVQIVTSKKDDTLIETIRNAGYAITVLDINASKFSGEKYMILSEIKHSQLNDLKKTVYQLDESAFIMVNETKYVFNGFFKA